MAWRIRFQVRARRARFPWMTQELLAIRSGLSRAMVRRLERGSCRVLRLEMLERLCLALECTPGELLAFEPDPPRPEHRLVPGQVCLLSRTEGQKSTRFLREG